MQRSPFLQTPSTVKHRRSPKVKKPKRGHDNRHMDTTNDDIAHLVLGITRNGLSPFTIMQEDTPGKDWAPTDDMELQTYGHLDLDTIDSDMDFGLVSENGELQLDISPFS